MASVDNRVVELNLDNAQFESAVKTSVGTLEKLKNALQFGKEKTGLDNLGKEANQVNFNGMRTALEGISSKFSALGAVGFTVIQNLTNGALNFGKQVVGSVLNPLFEGGKQRALNIEQAKFQFRGLGLDVTKSMKSALDAVKGTAYGLDAAAKVASQFGAAGLKSGKQMTGALRGVAGVAALTGSSFEDIGGIFTTVAGQGKLMGDQINQFAARGINIVAPLSKAMNKSQADVRKLVSEGKISFKDFASAMDNAFGAHAKEANQTFTGALANMRAALSRIGADIADPKLKGGRDIFNALTTVIDNLHEALGPALDLYAKFVALASKRIVSNLGDVDFSNLSKAIPLLVDSLKNLGTFTTSVIKPFKEAFRDIFPKSTTSGLVTFATAIDNLSKHLTLSTYGAENLRRTFRGFFAILDIGRQIFSGILKMFGDLITNLGGSSGGFLDFTGNVGDWLVHIDKVLKKGQGLTNFFSGLTAVLTGIAKGFGAAGSKITGVTDNLAGKVQPALQKVVDLFKNLGHSIANALSSTDTSNVLRALNVGLLAAIGLAIKKFFTTGFQFDIGGIGVIGQVQNSIRNMNITFMNMQRTLKSDALLKLGIAIALVTASIIALSLVDSEKLNSGITALAFAFAELLGAMKIMDQIGTVMSTVKMPVIAASLILLAGAIDLLVIAVVALAQLSWEQLLKGLGAVVVLLGALSAASIPLSANSKGMIQAGIGIAAMAVGINLLAGAVAIFGSMDLTTLAKGLGSVAAALVIIAAGMRVMPKGMVAQAAALVLIAAALQGIALALKVLGSSSWEEIGRGLASLAGALVILAIAMHAMTGTLAGSAALALAASSLALLAPALKLLGTMSWKEIARGLTALAAALIVLGVAGAVIQGISAGIIALGAAIFLFGAGVALFGAGINLIAKGLATLAKVGPESMAIVTDALVKFMQTLPQFVKALVDTLLEFVKEIAAHGPEFAKAFGVIIVTIANAIVKAAPQLGRAMSAIIVTLLQVIVDAAPRIIAAGITIILDLLKGISDNIGLVVKRATDIIVNFLGALSSNANRIVAAGFNFVISLVKGIADNIGKVSTAALSIITTIVTALTKGITQVVTAGGKILAGIVSGIAQNISKIIDKGGDIILAFVKGIGSKGSEIVTAAGNAAGKFINALSTAIVKLADTGATAMINFLHGIANVIRTREPEMIDAGVDIGTAIIDGMIKGLEKALPRLIKEAEHVVTSLPGKFIKVLGIGSPSKVFADIGGYIMDGLSLGISSDTGALDSITKSAYGIINGVKDVFQIESPSKVMQQIGLFVGRGFAQGLVGSSDDISKAFTDMNDKLNAGMENTRTLISNEQDKLEDLRKKRQEQLDHLAKLQKAKKPDSDAIKNLKSDIADTGQAIKDTNALITQNEALLIRLDAAHHTLGKNLTDERKKLTGLAKQYADVTQQLKDAQSALDDAVKTRDNSIKSFTDQYSTLPDIVTTDADGNPVDQLGTYMQSLQAQANAVYSYQSTLEQLRKLGLDDATYQKLLSEGTADQAFATQLLSGGKTAVDGLNALDGQLQSVSKTLGTNAGKNLYDAGVDAAQGIVNGLKSKQSSINKQMEKIAASMIKALKKKLGIKSPSTVFAEMGGYASEGMAKGLLSGAQMVTDAAETVAANAVSALQNSISKISEVVNDNMDSSPVITPVLDLTQVQEDAKKINDLTNVTPISAAASYNAAAGIAASELARQQAMSDSAPGKVLNFTQNNSSPESLSETEIYRQTKNQLAQAKAMLDTA